MKVIYSGEITDRVRKSAELFLEDGATVRSVADELGVSKSTVGVDLKYRVPKMCNRALRLAVERKLNENKEDALSKANKASVEKRKKVEV